MSITGLRLKNLRGNIHASQSDVAHAIGISRTAYVKYETGASKLVRKLHELAKYFNVSTDYLLGNENAEKPLSEEQATLLEGFDSLNAEGQNTLMTMLKSLRITHSFGSPTITARPKHLHQQRDIHQQRQLCQRHLQRQ